jgi:hypothetical protein
MVMTYRYLAGSGQQCETGQICHTAFFKASTLKNSTGEIGSGKITAAQIGICKVAIPHFIAFQKESCLAAQRQENLLLSRKQPLSMNGCHQIEYGIVF